MGRKKEIKKRKQNGGWQRLGGGVRGSQYLMGTELQFGKMKMGLEGGDGDGLMFLNNTIKNGSSSKFYVIYTLPHFFF